MAKIFTPVKRGDNVMGVPGVGDAPGGYLYEKFPLSGIAVVHDLLK